MPSGNKPLFEPMLTNSYMTQYGANEVIDTDTKYKEIRKTSSISRTKSPNLNVSCLALQLSLPNPLKPGVKLRMKM